VDYEGSSAVLYFMRDISDKMRLEEGIEALHSHAVNLAGASGRKQIYEITIKAVESVIGFHDLAILELREEGLVSVAYRGAPPWDRPLPLDGKGVLTRITSGEPVTQDLSSLSQSQAMVAYSA
jgi:hypothetical protein